LQVTTSKRTDDNLRACLNGDKRVGKHVNFEIKITVSTINVHVVRGMAARHEARNFGLTQARHNLIVSGPGLARPEGAGHAWAAA
jgi:hypothetical protein